MERISNTLIKVLDRYTGEYMVLNKVTTWGDGTAMSDLKCDNVMYRKVGTEYFLRQTNGELDVRWWGAIGDNATDNTTAFNNLTTFIRSQSNYRYIIKVPQGRFKTGKVDITGVFGIKGISPRGSIIRGLLGQDILYWKGLNEVGYTALQSLLISNLSLEIDDSQDVSATHTRIGFGGELVGNAAIHLPASIRPVIDNLLITSVNAPSSGVGNRCCAFFGSGAQYGLTLDGINNWQGVDYGLIVGTSDTYTPVLPSRISAFDGTTFTYTRTTPFTNGSKVALIWDINDVTIAGFNPRTLYYVVNSTATTFQLSTSSGGSAISGTYSIPGNLFVVPAGSDSIEYANDEWAWTQLRINTKRCSLSAANICETSTGHLVIQSNSVSARILNFPSANRQYSVNTTLGLLDTEGPQYSTMSNKEYGRIEGEKMKVMSGPYMAASTTGSYFTINTNNSFFYAVLTSNVDITSPVNYISLIGNCNELYVKADYNDTNVVDSGSSNRIIFTQRPSGDALRAPLVYDNKTINKIPGGFWPDYVKSGNVNAPYQSDACLFYPAVQQRYTATDINYRYDDSTIEIPGYVRKTGVGQLTVTSPFGSNFYQFAVNKFFPKSRWRLYAKIRSLTTSQNITLTFQVLSGSGTAASSITSVGTSWTVIAVDVDSSAADDALIGQFYVNSATEGYDIAWFYVHPYIGENLIAGNNTTWGNTGLGVLGSTAAAKLHVLSPTSPQVRIGYSSGVYMNISQSAAGTTTFAVAPGTASIVLGNPTQFGGTTTHIGAATFSSTASGQVATLPNQFVVLSQITAAQRIDLTTAQSDSDLNALYPSAAIGYRVIAKNTTGGGIIYEKDSATTWIRTSIVT